MNGEDLFWCELLSVVELVDSARLLLLTKKEFLFVDIWDRSEPVKRLTSELSVFSMCSQRMPTLFCILICVFCVLCSVCSQRMPSLFRILISNSKDGGKMRRTAKQFPIKIEYHWLRWDQEKVSENEPIVLSHKKRAPHLHLMRLLPRPSHRLVADV